MYRFASLLAVLALAVSLGARESAAGERPVPTPGDVGAFVDGIVEPELARCDVAGAVVVVVANGSVALSKGYGFADIRTKTPVDEHTLFRPGSISKLFTSLAVMQLVEQGRLDLDANVNRYLDFALPEALGKPVTLRQLLTHRAGFEERLRDLGNRDALPIPLRELVRSHTPRRARVPERSPAYSNYGVALAGYIVQRTAGVPFDRYIAQHIFAPLGMERATFEQPLPARLAPLMSRGYPVASQHAGPFETINDAPAGALSASGDAMARFLRMLLGGGELDGVRVISPAGFARWVAPQVVIAGNALGLTIYEQHPYGVRTLGHGGDLSYFHSELHALPERGFGVYVSQNSLGKCPRLLRAVLVPALLERYFAEERREPPPFAATPRGELIGSYMTTRRSDTSWLRLLGVMDQIEVSARRDGTLEARGVVDAAGNARRWREVAPLRFRSQDGEIEIEFKRGVGGRIVELQPWFPGITYERAGVLDTRTFALAVFAPALLIALGTLLAPIAGPLTRRALGAARAPTRALAPRVLARASAGVWLGGLGGFVAFALNAAQNVWRFSSGQDRPLVLAVLGLWLALALSLACGVVTLRERRPADASGVRHALRWLPPLAFLALAWFSWHWGLLSDPTRY